MQIVFGEKGFANNRDTVVCLVCRAGKYIR